MQVGQRGASGILGCCGYGHDHLMTRPSNDPSYTNSLALARSAIIVYYKIYSIFLPFSAYSESLLFCREVEISFLEVKRLTPRDPAGVSTQSVPSHMITSWKQHQRMTKLQ